MANTCGRKTEVYSRVVGYFRPLAGWNHGKKAEFADRTPFKVNGGGYADAGMGSNTVENANANDPNNGNAQPVQNDASAQAGQGAKEQTGEGQQAEKPEINRK